MHLHFNEHLCFEKEPGGDDILHIKHPNLEWVNLINGDEFFRGIRIDSACVKLKLVKFRGFEIEEFHNEANVRFYSEKNLLQDQDF